MVSGTTAVAANLAKGELAKALGDKKTSGAVQLLLGRVISNHCITVAPAKRYAEKFLALAIGVIGKIGGRRAIFEITLNVLLCHRHQYQMLHAHARATPASNTRPVALNKNVFD